MNKKLKAAIFAAAFISLGGAAYTYNQYGTQDNSMILANVEALSDDSGDKKEESGPNANIPEPSKRPSPCASVAK